MNHLYRRSQARKIAPGKAQLESGAADVFGPGGGNAAAQPAVVGSRVPWGCMIFLTSRLLSMLRSCESVANVPAVDHADGETIGIGFRHCSERKRKE